MAVLAASSSLRRQYDSKTVTPSWEAEPMPYNAEGLGNQASGLRQDPCRAYRYEEITICLDDGRSGVGLRARHGAGPQDVRGWPVSTGCRSGAAQRCACRPVYRRPEPAEARRV